jgi:hypothetical protein
MRFCAAQAKEVYCRENSLALIWAIVRAVSGAFAGEECGDHRGGFGKGSQAAEKV